MGVGRGGSYWWKLSKSGKGMGIYWKLGIYKTIYCRFLFDCVDMSLVIYFVYQILYSLCVCVCVHICVCVCLYVSLKFCVYVCGLWILQIVSCTQLHSVSHLTVYICMWCGSVCCLYFFMQMWNDMKIQWTMLSYIIDFLCVFVDTYVKD